MMRKNCLYCGKGLVKLRKSNPLCEPYQHRKCYGKPENYKYYKCHKCKIDCFGSIHLKYCDDCGMTNYLNNLQTKLKPELPQDDNNDLLY